MAAVVDLEIINTKEMKRTGLEALYVTGRIYRAHDTDYGEVHAMYVLTVGAVGVQGAPMFPKTGSFTVAADFLCDDDENGSGVCGEERCLGSWLGGVTTAASYGFVQIYGLNIVPLTTDGSIEAKDTVLPTATDGTWEGITSDVLMSAGTNNPATRCGFALAATVARGTVFWDVHQPSC